MQAVLVRLVYFEIEFAEKDSPTCYDLVGGESAQVDQWKEKFERAFAKLDSPEGLPAPLTKRGNKGGGSKAIGTLLKGCDGLQLIFIKLVKISKF